MPKPVLPDDLTAEMRVGSAAREIINAKVDEIAHFVQPALAGDFDGIHDMRVAVKRLREALRLFRRLIRKRRREHVVAMAQELNDALGAVRERDVLMADAAKLIESDPTASEVVQGLVDEWAQQRAQGLKALRSLWKRLDGSAEFFDETRRAARAAKRGPSSRNDLPLDQFAYAAITARADEAMQALEQARGSDDAHLLHLLRIAVKKLKYTMEPFGPIFPDLQAVYDVTADLQESLGLTHDYDVLLAALEDYFGRAGLAKSDAAVKVLKALGKERTRLYQAAHKDIERFDGETWYQQLLDAID